MKKVLAVTFVLCLGDALGMARVATVSDRTETTGHVGALHLVGGDKENNSQKNKNIVNNKVKTRKRDWVDTCADFVEGPYYLSQIALGSLVSTGSVALKCACWAVKAAPYFPPVSTNWVDGALKLAGSAVLKCSSWAGKNTSWFPSGLVNKALNVAGSGAQPLLLSSFLKISSKYGNFYKSVAPLSKIDDWSEKGYAFVNEWDSKNCGSWKPWKKDFWSDCQMFRPIIVGGGKPFFRMMNSDSAKSVTSALCVWSGWAGSIVVNYFAGDLIRSVSSASSSGIRYGNKKISDGFRGLRILGRNY